MKHYPAICILVFHFLIFAVINQYLNPHPDMLDHWVWSRYLSLSYYEHPPMIAWLIRGLTFIGGNSEVVLEVGSQIISLGILALVYLATCRLYGQHAALVTLLILCSMPYFTLGSIFLHITQPFLFFWVIALFLLVRFHQKPGKKILMLIGIVAGLGALSKYVMLLFYFGLFLHLLIFKKTRKEIFNPWIYLAGLVSLVVFSPVLFWNWQHDWISFSWQFERGTSGEDFGKNTLAFTAGHILLFSPIWFVMSFFLVWWIREKYCQIKSPETIISIISIFPLIFFTIMSFKGSIADPHWANLAYLGIAILLGNELLRRFKRKSLYIFLSIAIIINFVLSGAVVAHAINPIFDWIPYELKNFDYLKSKGVHKSTLEKLRKNNNRYFGAEEFEKQLRKLLTKEELKEFGELILKTAKDVSSDRLTRVIAWDETGKQLSYLLEREGINQLSFIVSREYQLSSTLTFYLPMQTWPHSIEKPERNLWSPFQNVKNGSTIFVCELQECSGSLNDFSRRFQTQLSYLGEIETRKGKRMIRNLQIYLLNP